MAFIQGIRLFNKHPKSPEFVLMDGVINPGELMVFLQEQKEDVKFQILMSKKGTPYIAINEWKKEDKPMPASQVPDKPDSMPEEDSNDILPF